MTRPLLVLPAMLLSAFFAFGCENDPAAKAEPSKPMAQAQQVAKPAPAVPAAAAPAGMCGSHEVEEKPGGCGAAAKAAEPSGCGCAAHDTGSADKPVVPVTQAKVGDRTRCPVTNSVFVVKGDSPKAELEGKTYHFCCEGCVNRFKQDPKQYLES